MHSGAQHMVARARRAWARVKVKVSRRHTSSKPLTPPSCRKMNQPMFNIVKSHVSVCLILVCLMKQTVYSGHIETLITWFGYLTSSTLISFAKQLVSWYFEPRQPQRITSGLKQLSPIYSSHKSSNHKFLKKHKISPGTNLYITEHTNVKLKIFKELVPSVSPQLKKHIQLGQAGIVDHSVHLSIPEFKKYKQGMDRSNKIYKKYHINA